MTKLPKPGELWIIGYQGPDKWILTHRVLICGHTTEIDREFVRIPVLYDGEYARWKEGKTSLRKNWKLAQEIN